MAKNYQDILVWKKANTLKVKVFAKLDGLYSEDHPHHWTVECILSHVKQIPENIYLSTQTTDVKRKLGYIMQAWCATKNFNTSLQNPRNPKFFNTDEMTEIQDLTNDLLQILAYLEDAIKIRMVKSLNG
jgi:hypothetical protein